MSAFVWMAVRRRGLDHHLFADDGEHTECGRFVGKPLKFGELLAAELVSTIASPLCPRCAGRMAAKVALKEATDA